MLLRGRFPRTVALNSRNLVRKYISVPDIIFGNDDDPNDPSPKKVKNPYVAHKAKGKFVGPWCKESYKSLTDVLRLVLSPNHPRFKLPKNYENKEVLKPATIDRQKIDDKSAPHITWMGHASCLYQVDGVYFLTDPVFEQRASPLSFAGPKRYYDPCCQIEDIPVDVILLSHTHYDHLDMPTVKKIGNKAHWVVPLGVKDLLASVGITNCVELDWWSTYHYLAPSGKTFEITFTPAKHWTSRTPFDRNTCLWGSFVLKSSKQKFFFSGDTAYCPVFKVIGDTFGPFDFSILSIGAYTPRWFMKDVHCDPEEAVQIHLDLKSKKSLAIHWGTFPLTVEDPIEPALELARVRDMRQIKVEQFFTTTQGLTMAISDPPKHDVAELHGDLYGHYLDTLRNAPKETH